MKIITCLFLLKIAIPDLKNLVHEKMGVPAELQRMIYKGKQLKDDKNLSDYSEI
jgi:hypothetical protein